MYYQHPDACYHLRHYQQNADDGRMLLPQHSPGIYDCELGSASASSSRNFAAAAAFHNPAVHDHHADFRNHHGGGTPAPMTSLQHHDVVQRIANGAPRGTTMMSRPSPYDCKPPYSYISLIAMAIESSPDHRFVKTATPHAAENVGQWRHFLASGALIHV